MNRLPPVGTEIPSLIRTPDAVDLFTFSAAAWLLHRIHYDLPFTTEHEKHPGLLIHGPLQGVYLVQTVENWLPHLQLRRLSYRHLAPAYLGDTLRGEGTVTASDPGQIETELRLSKDDGTVTTSGRAVFAVGR
ncbi:MAG TPA: hypothetical protein VJR05_12495 [Acidimicrobiia bacterium]|nr:hypothetical protein [Acidimicrobiia bacterium]